MSTTLPWDPFLVSLRIVNLTIQALRYCQRIPLREMWYRQRQAEQVVQQWYEAAVRNQARRLTGAGNTDRTPHGRRQDSPVPLSNSPGPVQSINPFVTAAMLCTNSVPWHISPAQPAILTSVTNIWAGFRD
ncbi:hypothetical protein PENFLA_c075G10820 [Penicillium flavigenum]|uniref:Uncharacterized protein n=1 Tax=Penicillium flavigenum TaxID=254877 RepID=A0A1V6SB16_9EURO|nr:hypothetical protein PENFLA_c075G10820 [Penicillium flavigenum]